MLFKKHREKKAQEVRDRQIKVENKFSAAMKEANRIEDPAEKILALQKVMDQIALYLAGETKSLLEKVNASEKRSDLVGDAGNLTFWLGMVAVTNPVGWVAMAGGGTVSMGATVVGGLRKRHIIKKHDKENAEHEENLDNLQTSIDKTIDEVLQSDVEGVVNSSSFVRLNWRDIDSRVKGMPDLSAKFNEMVIKRGEDARMEIRAFLDRVAARRKEAANKPASPDAQAEQPAPQLRDYNRKLILRNNQPKQ